MKFSILNRFDGDVICKIKLSASYENNVKPAQLGAATQIALAKKISLVGADLRGADLRSADLANADLTNTSFANADLTNANLVYANLRSADLANADLTRANLTMANLTRANLTMANLAGTNLTGTNLYDADLTGQGILQINGSRWSILITPDYMVIGCAKYSHGEWRKFSARRILLMVGKNGPRFWKENKPWLLKLCEQAANVHKKEA